MESQSIQVEKEPTRIEKKPTQVRRAPHMREEVAIQGLNPEKPTENWRSLPLKYIAVLNSPVFQKTLFHKNRKPPTWNTSYLHIPVIYAANGEFQKFLIQWEAVTTIQSLSCIASDHHHH